MSRCRCLTGIVLGALSIAVLYAPTLNAPFDFIDDGNLVYPAPPDVQGIGHLERWWERVADNYEHLGPFRPVLWAHWELLANLFDGNPLLWRIGRMAWCALAAGMFLWLLRELGFRFWVSMTVVAMAIWNPFRSEIWTSLTLGEGVAMPYALFALIAARRAAHSPTPLRWELASVAGVILALGCKNVFMALVPAQLALRFLSDGRSPRECWQRQGVRTLALSLTLILPLLHLVYFKLNWHPGQYETHSLSWEQGLRILRAMKGALGIDFVGVSLLATLVLVALPTHRNIAAAHLRSYRAAALAGGLLLIAGIIVYLPMSAMSGRYTMPAIWGIDLLLGILLASFAVIPPSTGKRLTLGMLILGLVILAMVNIFRQEKLKSRHQLFWQVISHLETQSASPIAIDWVSHSLERESLNVEEGIHLAWHMQFRAKRLATIGLINAEGQPLARVELPSAEEAASYRLSACPLQGWMIEKEFLSQDFFGRSRHRCYLLRRVEIVASR